MGIIQSTHVHKHGTTPFEESDNDDYVTNDNGYPLNSHWYKNEVIGRSIISVFMIFCYSHDNKAISDH